MLSHVVLLFEVLIREILQLIRLLTFGLVFPFWPRVSFSVSQSPAAFHFALQLRLVLVRKLGSGHFVLQSLYSTAVFRILTFFGAQLKYGELEELRHAGSFLGLYFQAIFDYISEAGVDAFFQKNLLAHYFLQLLVQIPGAEGGDSMNQLVEQYSHASNVCLVALLLVLQDFGWEVFRSATHSLAVMPIAIRGGEAEIAQLKVHFLI